jgi:hypothetical protein
MAILISTGLLLMTTMATPGEPVKAKVDDLSWLRGNWTCPQFGGTFEEHWMPASGGSMQGCGKLVVGGKTEFMEYMSIEPQNGGVTMWMLLGAPSKGEKKGVPFQLTSLKGKKATFENPKNDFPTKMTYELKSNGNLDCSIEGTQGGKHTVEKFPFKPIK